VLNKEIDVVVEVAKDWALMVKYKNRVKLKIEVLEVI
jgi:hypothetical protein